MKRSSTSVLLTTIAFFATVPAASSFRMGKRITPETHQPVELEWLSAFQGGVSSGPPHLKSAEVDVDMLADSEISYDSFIPSSVWKCLFAAVAGSAFAVAGMYAESVKKPKEKAIPRAELGRLIPKRPVKAPETVAPAPAARAAPSQPSITESTPRTPSEGSPKSSSPAGAWRPGSRLTKDQQVERQIKSILNKLTRENFDRLYQQLLECGIAEQAHVECLAREVFSKATTQHQFIEMYADLCTALNTELQERGKDLNFKRVLLDRCQQSFGQYLEKPKVDETLSYEEQYEELVKYKTKMLGNVRLVGQLLSRKMLSPKIIFLCVDELMRCGTDEALETLCAFLESVGPTFDKIEWAGHGKLNEVFGLVKVLALDAQQTARTRCLLQDLCDKRERAWQKAAPKAPAEAPRRPSVVQRSRSGADADSCWRNTSRTDRTPTPERKATSTVRQ